MRSEPDRYRSGCKDDRKHEGDRIFFTHSTDANRTGWYFYAREGTFGPFEAHDTARAELAKLISANRPGPRERYQSLWLKLKR